MPEQVLAELGAVAVLGNDQNLSLSGSRCVEPRLELESLPRIPRVVRDHHRQRLRDAHVRLQPLQHRRLVPRRGLVVGRVYRGRRL